MIFPSSRACLRPLLSDCNFKIGGKVIEFVSSYSHLGLVITDSLDDGPDISKRQDDFIGQVNSVLCDFRQLLSIVKYRLFNSYCTSFYGSELWQLSNAKLVNFGITWRKSVRKIWNLPLLIVTCSHFCVAVYLSMMRFVGDF